MINSETLKRAILSAINNLTEHRAEVDSMNIFPVPDGDTGTNMSLTIGSAKNDLNTKDYSTVSELSEDIASNMLKGSRGNSGVILSLLFRGFAEGLKGLETATASDIINALDLGVKSAYRAVANPIEGTILTVARLACEGGKASLNKPTSNIETVFSSVYNAAIEALDSTPKLLPVLKKAGVVDAGGKGFCLVLEGMLSVIKDNHVLEFDQVSPNQNDSIKSDIFAKESSEFDGDIRFTYCTEFTISKYIVDRPIENQLRKYLKSIGDCIVIVEDTKIIKVHVHTESPGAVLQQALKYGELLSVKVDNMKEQHRKIQQLEVSGDKGNGSKKEKLEIADPTEEFGFVAVAAGDGLKSLFQDLGCANVINGGQSMNPSTDDICEAIMATPAKTVFVLPNNKNIILAANQTVSLIKDRCVRVMPTKTIPQGISAIMSFNPSLDVGENETNMISAANRVLSGQVTFAARKSEYGGFKIKRGDIIALEDGKLTYVDTDPVKITVKLVKHMVNSHSSFVTLFQGENISDETAESCLEILKSKLSSNIEINLIRALQPIYYFIISVE